MYRFFLFLMLAANLTIIAAEPIDSCMVYGYLRWTPSATKYAAKLELGPGKDLEDIKNSSGEKLIFQSFLNALNYMSSEGWEVLEISPLNPENNSFTKEQYAIIRKKMMRTEASLFYTPQNNK